MIEKNYIGEIFEGECSDAKSRIIKAGLEEFAVNSLKAARTRGIAAKAGVNHAAISYYFGGKTELYRKIAEQITEFIAEFMSEFHAKAEAVFKTRSAKDAKLLIKEYLMSRVCVESENEGEVLRWIILIITKEEVYQTKIFDIFYKKVFKRSGDMMSSLVEIASRGKICGSDAMIVGQMLIGQIHMFNSARASFKRLCDWKTFSETEVSMVEKNVDTILNGIF